METPQFEAALRIVETLRAQGYEAYLAGGCVRDLLLGREPADYDVATNATPDVVLDMFPRTFAVGAHFGVVLVAPEIEDAGFVTEVATFRSDLAYSDGRHPDAVRYTTSAEEDVRAARLHDQWTSARPTAWGRAFGRGHWRSKTPSRCGARLCRRTRRPRCGRGARHRAAGAAL